MIIDNKIYFGYGSVLVGSDMLYGLKLTAIKPPQPIGPLKSLEGIEFGQIVTSDDVDKLCTLKAALKEVDSSVETEIPFDKYTLVFVADSEQSLNILRKAVNHAINLLILPTAC